MLNKLLTALSVGPMPEGTDETNLVQTLGVIATAATSDDGDDQETAQQSGSGAGPTSDYAMANKIAKK